MVLKHHIDENFKFFLQFVLFKCAQYGCVLRIRILFSLNPDLKVVYPVICFHITVSKERNSGFPLLEITHTEFQIGKKIQKFLFH